MEEQARKAVVELERALKAIQSCLAWRELERAERQKSALPFFFKTSTEKDLKEQIGRFWKTSAELELTFSSLSVESQQALRPRILTARSAYQRLAVAERLLYP